MYVFLCKVQTEYKNRLKNIPIKYQIAYKRTIKPIVSINGYSMIVLGKLYGLSTDLVCVDKG